MPLAGRLLRDPRLGLLATVGILGASAYVGRFWQVLGLLVAFAVVVWCWWDERGARRVAVLALFASQMMMALIWLRPGEINYPVYAILMVLVVGVTGTRRRRVIGGVLPLALAWLLLNAASSTLTLHPAPVYALLAVPLGLVGIYLLQLTGTDQDISFFLAVVIGFAVVQSLIGLAQTLVGLPGFTAYSGSVYVESRNYLAIVLPVSQQVRMATGTFEHFNGLGAMLALATPIAFSRWLDSHTFRRSAALAIIVCGLVATFSRGALLGAFVGCSMLFVIRGRGSLSHGLRAATTALMTGSVGLTTYEAVRAYVMATGNLASRLGAWVLAVGTTLGDPVKLLFGAGFGYYASGFLVERGAVARLHSAPIQAFAELGLVGVVLLSAGLLPPVVRGLRSESNVQRCLAAASMAFLIHQIFDNALFGVGGIVFLGVIAGLISIQRRESEEPRTLEVTLDDAA